MVVGGAVVVAVVVDCDVRVVGFAVGTVVVVVVSSGVVAVLMVVAEKEKYVQQLVLCLLCASMRISNNCGFSTNSKAEATFVEKAHVRSVTKQNTQVQNL